jgi:hypothetical protein
MRLPRFLKSKKFWGGAATGLILGPWAIKKGQQITGIGVSYPQPGGNGS